MELKSLGNDEQAPLRNSTLPQSVRYVKNGSGGAWWADAKSQSRIHAGWANIAHDAIRFRDTEALSNLHRESFGQRTGQTQDLNALLTLIIRPSEHIWITFEGGFLWWATASDNIIINEGETSKRGHFWLITPPPPVLRKFYLPKACRSEPRPDPRRALLFCTEAS